MIKPKKTIEQLSPYETDLYKKQWRLKLDSNENIYGTSNVVISAIKNINPEDISLYPCYGKLLDKLEKRYNIANNEILLTNGCDEALNIIISTFLDEGDEILSYTPTFSMPSLYARAQGGIVKTVEYSEKFKFLIDDVEKGINDKTKIFYCATPNNPTGEVVKASVIELLIKKYPEILFIVDCTYTNYSESVTFEDYLDLIKKYDNLAVVKSFSKDFALAGLRLGFICAQNEIINNLKKVSSPYNVNVVALYCAQAALNDEKHFEEIKANNLSAKELLFQGLIEKGFKPYPSEGNFILCDFYDWADFYYEKLKKNGVIVRNFKKSSPVSTCLRLTVPKTGGVKYILELLNKKDMLIFDLDGVVFDVRDSYNGAIIQTFKHFAGYEITQDDISKVKNLGGYNCDWDATKYLLDEHNINVDLDTVTNVFQDLFYNPELKGRDFLIDKEKLLISKETFEKLSQKYDLAIFSGRLRLEADYSLKKFGIDKYFYYYVTSDDLTPETLKPNPLGVKEILKHCPYKTIKYLGDSVDDIIAGNAANVTTIGVVSPGSDYNAMVNNFKHLGANYILKDINEIIDFLEETEKNYDKIS